MDTLEKLKMKRAELDKNIEMLESTGQLFDRFQRYFLLTSCGVINTEIYDDVNVHINNVSQGNAFKNLLEAEKESERRKLLHRFKIFRDKCNDGWKADFEDFDRKYFIIFDADNERVVVVYQNFYDYFNIFGYFKNESDAQKAIELFGDEIKRLYVEV